MFFLIGYSIASIACMERCDLSYEALVVCGAALGLMGAGTPPRTPFPPARGFCHARFLFVRLGVSCLDAVRVFNRY